MKFYIVNYKETELNTENVFDVQCGTCDEGFTDIEKAIAKMKELAKDKVCECVEEMGYDENEVVVTDEECKEYDPNSHTEYVCVGCGSNTYEYYVYEIVVG